MQLRIEVERYKAFADPVSLLLRPLTVIFGENGVGKSALSRLPLLLHRAMSAREADPGLPLQVGGVVFGRTALDLWHGAIPDAMKVKLETAAGTLSATIDREPSSLVYLPRQRVKTWSFVTHPKNSPGATPIVAELWAQPGRRWSGTLEQMGAASTNIEADGFAGLWPLLGGFPLASPKRPRLANVHHLLTHRSPGDTRVFVAPDSRPDSVGASGENTHRLLAWHGGAPSTGVWGRVCGWAKELFGVELRLQDIQAGSAPQALLEGRRGEGPWLPLDTFGTGFAHALPVLAQLAAADGGDGEPALLTVEEPEANLRPALQASLADCFIKATTNWGARCLVETHSETFLLRLQRRVVENPALAPEIGVIWVDSTGADLTVHNLNLNQDGDIEGFPEGWFDAPVQEAQAVFRARRERR